MLGACVAPFIIAAASSTVRVQDGSGRLRV